MPLAERPAEPPVGSALRWVTVAEAVPHELCQVAGDVPLTSWTPARELVPVLEDLAEGPDFDALHGQSMIARQGQAVSSRN